MLLLAILTPPALEYRSDHLQNQDAFVVIVFAVSHIIISK